MLAGIECQALLYMAYMVYCRGIVRVEVESLKRQFERKQVTVGTRTYRKRRAQDGKTPRS